jgi:hypothetical protein
MELTAASARSMEPRFSPLAIARSAIATLETWLAPVVDLAVRVVAGAAFFQSRLAKIRADTTLALFENDTASPPPEEAAAAPSPAAFPVLLVLLG